MEKVNPIPGKDERLAIRIHSQHVASSKDAEREGNEKSHRVTIRRAMAFALDCGLLAALGLGLARLLGPRLPFLDESYWWAGLAIAAIYFGFFDSRLSFGMTIGKRIMDIEVKRLDGEEPKSIDALLRFAPFAIAFATFKISRLADSHDPIVLAFELAGAICALSVLVITPLHPARRGGHDLLMGTVVMRRKSLCTVPPGSTKLAMLAFVTACTLVTAGQGARAWHMTEDAGQRDEAAMVRLITKSMPNMRHVRIGTYRITLEGSGYKRALKVSAYSERHTPEKHLEVQARRIASKLRGGDLLPEGISLIAVEMKTGFDIGIWRNVSSRVFKFPLYGRRMRRAREPGEPNVRYKVMRKG